MLLGKSQGNCTHYVFVILFIKYIKVFLPAKIYSIVQHTSLWYKLSHAKSGHIIIIHVGPDAMSLGAGVVTRDGLSLTCTDAPG